MNRRALFAIQFALGVALALVAAFFMIDGDTVGENTTGIAIVILIIGLGLIATSPIRILS